MVLSIRAESVSDGNRKLTWPLFKPSNKDPVLGKQDILFLWGVFLCFGEHFIPTPPPSSPPLNFIEKFKFGGFLIFN